MSKKFLLSLSYLSLCKFFWTRTENRVIENRVMENRVKRGITVYDFILLGTFFLMGGMLINLGVWIMYK